MAIVTFVYADWKALYPQFDTTVIGVQAQNCFNQATLYCANTDAAIVPYEPQLSPPITARLDILYLLTAHVAQLQYGAVIGGTLVPAGPIVGRISSATQGSVSVSAEMKAPDSAAWFMQTQWGASAGQAMAQYRTARYRPNPGRYWYVGAPWPAVPGRFQ